jgi:uncharacterized protein (TIGR02596 family)
MRIFNRFSSSPSRRSAFSLIEMLAVLAIISIITAAAVPIINSTFRSYQLDSAGQVMINQLNLARQTALSQGRAVQVRLYLLPDYNLATSGTPVVYRGMQSFIESDPTTNSVTPPITALVKPTFFQAPVIISSATSPNPVSPILPTTATTPLPTDPSLPIYQTNYKYATFHFKPDGSTDLSSGANSVSLVLENDKTAANGLPANFQTIEIDPLNGAVQSFRP